MEGSNDMTDAEFLYKMRIEYLQAVQVEDYGRISGVIVPRFWDRFSKYYEEYSRSWKSLASSRLPIQVIIDPGSPITNSRESQERLIVSYTKSPLA